MPKIELEGIELWNEMKPEKSLEERKRGKRFLLPIIALSSLLLIFSLLVFIYSSIPKINYLEIEKYREEEYTKEVTNYREEVIYEEREVFKEMEKKILYNQRKVKHNLKFSFGIFSWSENFTMTLDENDRLRISVANISDLGEHNFSFRVAFFKGLYPRGSPLFEEIFAQSQFLNIYEVEPTDPFAFHKGRVFERIFNVKEKGNYLLFISFKTNDQKLANNQIFHVLIVRERAIFEKVKEPTIIEIPYTEEITKKREVPYLVKVEEKTYPNLYLRKYSLLPLSLGLVLSILGFMLKRK
ncbi:MAG: hypothetical protein ACE5K0_03395 [Candidatus Methanofastidiosia archaeon]